LNGTIADVRDLQDEVRALKAQVEKLEVKHQP
jgi:hypothetical protein